MVLDFLFKNKIEMDVSNAMNQLIKKTLSSCSNDPRAFGLPMVKYWLLVKHILVVRNYLKH